MRPRPITDECLFSMSLVRGRSHEGDRGLCQGHRSGSHGEVVQVDTS